MLQACAAEVSEDGSRGKEYGGGGGEQFYEEVLLPRGGNLGEGLAGHLADGLDWLLACCIFRHTAQLSVELRFVHGHSRCLAGRAAQGWCTSIIETRAIPRPERDSTCALWSESVCLWVKFGVKMRSVSAFV